MGDLTENFSRKEFTCSCGCGFDTVDYETLLVLQNIRDHFGAEVVITSGCRCVAYNTVTPGAVNDSYHTYGKGVDFYVKGVNPEAVYIYLDIRYPNKYGLGLYKDRAHFDCRKYRARWGYSLQSNDLNAYLNRQQLSQFI